MQKYVTPAPGRTPSDPKVIDREDYKLHVTVKEYRPEEYHVEIRRFMMDSGWHTTQFFLTAEELSRLQSALTPA